jgi:putative transcriptional regulator
MSGDEVPPTLTGRLLVAGPHLLDPNFIRSVVLICRHDTDGALGLILNRPTDIPVGDHLPGWTEPLAAPEVVFVGGPVEPQIAVGLGRRRGPEEPPGWSAVTGDLGLIDLGAPPGEAVGHLRELRVFSGYAGWSSGQLDFEASSEDWFVVDAEVGDAFSADTEHAWRSVLRRQSDGLALYGDFPLNPSAN